MREIVLNVEGVLIVRDPDEPTASYIGNRDEFEADFGIVLPEMLDGMAAWSYRPDDKILVRYDKKGNAFPVEGAYHFKLSDSIYAAKDRGIQRQADRRAAARAAIEAEIQAAADAQRKAAEAAATVYLVDKVQPVRL